jgi:hypothetical protein
MTNPITLDQTSWVEHVTGWLPGPDADDGRPVAARLAAQRAQAGQASRPADQRELLQQLPGHQPHLIDSRSLDLVESACRSAT